MTRLALLGLAAVLALGALAGCGKKNEPVPLDVPNAYPRQYPR